MTPAELRKELGEVILRLSQIERDAYAAGLKSVAQSLTSARHSLMLANNAAGRLLVAQLTDADRAQADEAGRRA